LGRIIADIEGNALLLERAGLVNVWDYPFALFARTAEIIGVTATDR